MLDSNEVHRFDVWYADLPGFPGSHVQFGMRPVVVISNNAANQYSPVVTIVPLTSKIKPNSLPTHTVIHTKGLQVPSVALCEQVMTIDRRRLVNRIGAIRNRTEQRSICCCIQLQLGFAPLHRITKPTNTI